jgi:hypothetical protein
MRFLKLRLATCAILIACGVGGAQAAALGTAFTYQGRVDRNNVAVNDTYSMIFKLYDAATGGTQVGGTQTVNGIVATNGLFSATVDFGAGIFTGQALWLDVQIKGSGDASYTPMSSRQPITAAPYALFALNGGSGGSPWANDANGIDYLNHVGIGTPSNSTARLEIASGVSANENPAYIHTANPNYAALYFGNTAGGCGLYDSASGFHYLQGRLGVGTVNPQGKMEVTGSYGGIGIRASTGGNLINVQNAAIMGIGNDGTGPSGTAATGVWGQSINAEGVYGQSTNYIGVYGYSTNMDGTWGYSAGANKSGVVGISSAATGKGGYFRNDGGGVALYSDGLAKIKTLQILGGADLAERFDTASPAAPGTVMAIDPESPGRVRVAEGAYSRTVAGVVSGANGLDAGVELGKGETREGTVALALTGRVWVRCDATRGAIHPGDLLTTSDRAGHAMVASDHERATGAILGKAMTSLEQGTGLVLVLVSLQ